MAEVGWNSIADEEARDIIEAYISEMVEMLADDGEISDNIYRNYRGIEDFGDRSFSLIDAAHALSELSRYEETDDHFWYDLKDPQEAVCLQASLAYRNAVMANVMDWISTVNDDVGDTANAMINERKRLEDQVDAIEALDEITDAQESRLDSLRIELQQFDINRKKRLKDLILESIGRREPEKKARGPKDWNPRRS